MNRIVKFIFTTFERTVVKINKWDYIPNSSKKLFYIAPHIYKGREIKISDGTIIRKGDLVAELHVDNLKTDSMKNDFKTLFSIFQDELEILGYAIMNKKDIFEDIKAFHGTTVLYPITKRQGFTIIDLEDGFKKSFLRIWENVLRRIFRKNKLRSKNSFRMPKECWISSEQILKYAKRRGEFDEKEGN